MKLDRWTRLLLFFGIKKLGCKYCLLFAGKDVAFRKETDLLNHMDTCPNNPDKIFKDVKKDRQDLNSLLTK